MLLMSSNTCATDYATNTALLHKHEYSQACMNAVLELSYFQIALQN